MIIKKIILAIFIAITISNLPSKASLILLPFPGGKGEFCTYANKGSVKESDYTFQELIGVMRDLEAYKSGEILDQLDQVEVCNDKNLHIPISYVWDVAVNKALNEPKSSYKKEVFIAISEGHAISSTLIGNASERKANLEYLASALFNQQDPGSPLSDVSNTDYDQVVSKLMKADEFKTFAKHEKYRWMKLFHAYVFKEDKPL